MRMSPSCWFSNLRWKETENMGGKKQLKWKQRERKHKDGDSKPKILITQTYPSSLLLVNFKMHSINTI